jgi:hypothetical protein
MLAALPVEELRVRVVKLRPDHIAERPQRLLNPIPYIERKLGKRVRGNPAGDVGADQGVQPRAIDGGARIGLAHGEQMPDLLLLTPSAARRRGQ